MVCKLEEPIATSCRALFSQENLNKMEVDLQQWRNQMELGWTDMSGQMHKASSVQLSNMMHTDANEDIRKACWEVMP